MKKLSILLFLGFTFLFLLSGCGEDDSGGSDCSDAINNMIKQNGNPEEVQKYDSGDYHSWTYWYWCRGWSATFTWGSLVGKCETSTYTFSPICKY